MRVALLAGTSHDRAPGPVAFAIAARLHGVFSRSDDAFERFLGRLVVGAEVMGHASWEQARVHLTRAVELRPDFMPFRTAMGAYYARNGRGAEAKAEFRRALELATSHPWDRALATEARERLDNVLTWAPDPPKKEGEPGGG